MKVYVVYYKTVYDGCSIPYAVFSTEEKASAYCKKNGSFDWEELLLDQIEEEEDDD